MHQAGLSPSNQTGSGAVNAAAAFWLKLPLSTWLAQWIREGVPLHWEDLKVKAPACFIANHKGALEHTEFVSESVHDLLLAGAIQQVAVRPKCAHPLNVVPKKNGKLRLILDLRHVNQFLHRFKFKFETLTEAAMLVQPGDLLCSADLTNGYRQLRMREDTYETCHTYSPNAATTLRITSLATMCTHCATTWPTAMWCDCQATACQLPHRRRAGVRGGY